MCINVVYMNLPKGSHGASTCNEDGSFTVFLDPRDSTAMQKYGYGHELGHIMNNDFVGIVDKDVGIIEIRAHRKRL